MEVEEGSNLGDLFGPVRDQGERPTCLAFAISDLHAGLRDNWVPLSCEFIFYHAQRRAGRPPDVGATLTSTLEALRHDGQPREEGWPYLTIPPAGGNAGWKPPPDVGEIYRRTAECRPNIFGEIVAALDDGKPLLALLCLSISFYLVAHNGLIDAPAEEKPDISQRHAVVVIGHGMHDGRRVFLIRNSWGAEWGQNGHAWLTEEFLKSRLLGYCFLKESTDVTSPEATT